MFINDIFIVNVQFYQYWIDMYVCMYISVIMRVAWFWVKQMEILRQALQQFSNNGVEPHAEHIKLNFWKH